MVRQPVGKDRLMFFIFTLPRSRSAWLSKLLSIPPAVVGHDVVVNCDTIDDFLEMFADETLTGTVETGSALGWRIIRREFPEAKFAVVRRRKRDVQRSLRNFGIRMSMDELWDRDELLCEIASQPGTLLLNYSDLDDYNYLDNLCHHCLGVQLLRDRWEHFRGQNIQIDMSARIRVIREKQGAFAKLRQEVGELNKGLVQ